MADDLPWWLNLSLKLAKGIPGAAGAAVRDMGRQPIDQAEPLVRASQQEHAAVGADRAAVEGGGHLLVQGNRLNVLCND